MDQIIHQLIIAISLTLVVLFILYVHRSYKRYKAHMKSDAVQITAANRFKTEVMDIILKDLDKMPMLEIQDLIETLVKYNKLFKKLENERVMTMLDETVKQLEERKVYLEANPGEDIKLMQYQIEKLFLSLEDEERTRPQ